MLQKKVSISALAFGCPVSKREALRKEIVARYGEKHELIAPTKEPQSKRKKKRNCSLIFYYDIKRIPINETETDTPLMVDGY